MEMFGYGEILRELNGDGIHSLTNILTLSGDAHKNFDNFMLWFETMGAPHPAHTYWICVPPVFSSIPHHEKTRSNIVTFRVHGDAGSSLTHVLPNPKYLRIHAAICKVARMSGAAGYYALEQSDMDEGGGSAVSVFAEALATRLEGIGGVYDIPFSPLVDPV